MKKIIEYLKEKMPFKKEVFFFLLGACITFFQGSRDQSVSVEDQASAKFIMYKQAFNDSVMANKNAFGEQIIKNREMILPAILQAPRKIDSLERELRIAREERDFYKNVVNN